MQKKVVLSVLVFLSYTVMLSMASPAYMLHGDAGAFVSQDSYSIFVQGGGAIYYRSAFLDKGYFRLQAMNNLSYYFLEENGFADNSRIDASLLFPFQTFELEASMGSSVAFNNRLSAVSVLQPRWGMAVLIPAGFISPRWEVGYNGAAFLDSDKDVTELKQNLLFSFILEPNIRVQYELSAAAMHEAVWTNDQRIQSLGVHAKTGISGLIAYFTAWDVFLGGAWIVSDDSSQSLAFGSLGTEWAWSPIRQISVSADLALDFSRYYVSEQNALNATVGIRADYTANDRLYFVLGAGADATIADYYETAVWNNVITVGIEFAF